MQLSESLDTVSADTVFLNRIDCIQLLRVIAAVCIAVYHMFAWTAFGQHLDAGIHLFYCITAFLAMYTTQEPSRRRGFIRRRLIRILPLYWLITIATYTAAQIAPAIAAAQGSIGAKNLVYSMLFIPYYRSGMKTALTIRPIVGPAWTLYYDLYFTVIFWGSMKINHKYRGCISGAICLALSLAGCCIHNPGSALLSILFSGSWCDFIAGIAVFELLKRKKDVLLVPISIRIKYLLIGAAAASMFALYSTRAIQPVTGVLCLFILLLFIIAAKDHPFKKAVVSLGNISYSFYLIHYYYIIIMGKFVDWNTINIKSVAAAIAVVGIAAVTAFITYYLIEVNVGNFLKTILLKTPKRS